MAIKPSIISGVSRKLRKEIQTGLFGDKDRLPPVRELASRMDLSVPTILDGIKQLERQGVVRRRQGSGVYVKPLSERNLEVTVLQPDYPSSRWELLSNAVADMCQRQSFNFARRIVPLEPVDETGLPEFSDVLVYMAPSNPLQPYWLAAALERCQLLVIMDQMISYLAADSISVDGLQMACVALEHLAELGHRRVAYVHSSADLYETLIRYSTAAARAVELGIEMKRVNCNMQPGGDAEDLAYWAVMDEIKKGAFGFTAMLVENFAGAVGTLRACQDIGISVPEEISIVGLNDEPAALACDPPLTVVADSEDGFTRALEVMIEERVMKRQAEYMHILVPGKLIVRGSTASSGAE
jgi:DNA-binding transcriptional regulator YhcF (GntR family)